MINKDIRDSSVFPNNLSKFRDIVAEFIARLLLEEEA